MAKKIAVKLSEEEIALIKRLREGVAETEVSEAPKAKSDATVQTIADALTVAIERTKPPVKITVANRKARTPWTPPDGEPVVKLKRKYYHHSLPIEEKLSNAEKTLLNQIKPGRYCEGHVVVKLRNDRGIDIDYPVRTNSQRLLLVNKFGVTSFSKLLERIIDEKQFPSKYRKPEDKDLYDLDE